MASRQTDGSRTNRGNRVWEGRGDRLQNARLTIFDARISDDTRCHEPHFRVMAHVGRQNNARGWLRVSQSELAERWGLHRNSVNRAFGDLVCWGYLLKRSQTQSGESFCQYKVALDGGDPPAERGVVADAGCTTGGAPHGGLGAQPHCAPHTLYTRARRQTPTTTEKKPPLPPQAGGQSSDGFSGTMSGPAVEALRALVADCPRDPVVERVLLPLLAKKRFSAADPAAALAQVCTRANGLSAAHLDKVLEILLAADVKVIKAERMFAAIEAVHKGGLMLVIARGEPEFAAWLRHYEQSKPNIAALMTREGKWQVPARFPPTERTAA